MHFFIQILWCELNSKQSTIALAFSDGCNTIPEGPRKVFEHYESYRSRCVRVVAYVLLGNDMLG
jgi:hypothetical protein